jgi:hypothetical protein
MLVKMTHDEGKTNHEKWSIDVENRVWFLEKAVKMDVWMLIVVGKRAKRGNPEHCAALRLFVNSIEILAEDLVHGEHMHAILFEHRSERFVTSNLTLVFRIL